MTQQWQMGATGFACPMCGTLSTATMPGGFWQGQAAPSPWMGQWPQAMGGGPGWGALMPWSTMHWYGLGGLRRWGGTFSPQFQATGTPTDEEVEEMIYDMLDDDPLIPYDADIEVTSDAGVVTLRGEVSNKRIKHSAGDNAWWIPGVVDVRNELVVTGRRRARGAPAEETPAQQRATA
ncbi:MAG: BON domain-containing protein [Chloroflexi bacterium]|nr:BON domain-containing protein [Chloroflexota bacterium]